jgi:hypothetical protein
VRTLTRATPTNVALATGTGQLDRTRELGGFHPIHNFGRPPTVLTMNKPVSIALLAIGIVLIVFGVNASNSFGSSVSRFFTGSPTDKAIWLIIGGVLASIVGLVGLVRGKTT